MSRASRSSVDLAYPLRAALQADDGAREDPIRQRAHPARVLGVLLDELGGRLSAQDLASHARREDLDLNPVLLPQVEGRVLVVLQEEGAHLARHVVRHAGAAGVRAPARVGLPVGAPGDGLLTPPYPLLLNEDGHLVPLRVEVRELLPEAEEAFAGRRSVGEVDPVVGPLHLSLEAQTLRRRGREGEPVSYPAGAAVEEPALQDKGFSLPLDRIYRLVRT